MYLRETTTKVVFVYTGNKTIKYEVITHIQTVSYRCERGPGEYKRGEEFQTVEQDEIGGEV